jgi:hypothetical protein
MPHDSLARCTVLRALASSMKLVSSCDDESGISPSPWNILICAGVF